MDVLLKVLGLVLCLSSTSLGHSRKNVKSASIHNEGRIEELDDLIRRNVDVINTNQPEFMSNFIKEAETIVDSMNGDDMADYYLKLIKNIESKGIDFVHDERERLILIIETTGGMEHEEARHQKNVVEGLVDMIAEHLMTASMMNGMDMMGGFDLDMMKDQKIHDEI